MAEYRVMWEIDVEADSPREAALEARSIQLDADSTALVFVCFPERPLIPERAHGVVVDLGGE